MLKQSLAAITGSNGAGSSENRSSRDEIRYPSPQELVAHVERGAVGSPVTDRMTQRSALHEPSLHFSLIRRPRRAPRSPAREDEVEARPRASALKRQFKESRSPSCPALLIPSPVRGAVQDNALLLVRSEGDFLLDVLLSFIVCFDPASP